MKIKPLHDRILVKRLGSTETTKGGIIIPDTAKEKPAQGEIIAAGEGKRTPEGTLIPLDVKVGDLVLFSKYGGSEIEFDGEKLLIMNQDDVLGIIEK